MRPDHASTRHQSAPTPEVTAAVARVSRYFSSGSGSGGGGGGTGVSDDRFAQALEPSERHSPLPRPVPPHVELGVEEAAAPTLPGPTPVGPTPGLAGLDPGRLGAPRPGLRARSGGAPPTLVPALSPSPGPGASLINPDSNGRAGDLVSLSHGATAGALLPPPESSAAGRWLAHGRSSDREETWSQAGAVGAHHAERSSWRCPRAASRRSLCPDVA